MFKWLILLGLLEFVCVAGAQVGGLVDARAVIAAEQARLGGGPGVVVLNRAARLEGGVTLGVGQGLRIAAPLSVAAGATVRLMGHNEVRCEAEIGVDAATDLFVAEGATDVSVRGCDVTVKGRAGGYLLTATRGARVVVEGNHLEGMAIFNTHNTGGEGSQTTDVSITGNSTEMRGGERPIGVYLLYVLRGVVANNRFVGTGHGVQWWGGDGNIGWHGAEAVQLAGFLTVTGNECEDAGGACVWGSMGEDVAVTGNVAEGCGDVCFDTEGGVRNLFTGNVARGCAAGCYSVQMESEDAVFTGNFAYADAKSPALALVLIKHRNGNPAAHGNLTVTGNTLSCGNLCTAFYSEGEGGLDFSHNTLVNGLVRFANYTNDVRMEGNSLRFTVGLGGQVAVVGPSEAWGHLSVIRGNTVVARDAARSACVAQGWSDDNNTDEMRIEGNFCAGFGMGVVTETAGHNAGAPRAVWVVRGNEFSGVPAGQEVVHRRTSGNEVYQDGTENRR